MSRSTSSWRSRGIALFLTLLALLTGGRLAHAQFGPPGIFGGVPDPDLNRGFIVSARITSLNSSRVPLQITLPVNGILNYVFFYQPTSTFNTDTFLGGGLYLVEYIDVFGIVEAVAQVQYTPNSGFTVGVPVPGNPNNPFPPGTIPGALGIQGTVSVQRGRIISPVFNARVELFSAVTGQLVLALNTNANGFYSFYYGAGVNKFFIQPGKYLVRTRFGANTQTIGVTYVPNTDVTSPLYYVGNARVVANFVFGGNSWDPPLE